MRTTTDQDRDVSVAGLISSNARVPAATTVRDTAELFFANEDLDAAAVVMDNGEPAALVTRTKLMFKLFRRFGFELFGRRPILAVADERPLIVSDTERLDVVIDRALDRRPEDVYDEIIVTGRDGAYRGLLSVKQLVTQQSNALARTTLQREMESDRARELERVNEMKSQFMAHVTHELRSPVNVIIGLAELMRIALDKGAVDQVRERLASIISNASHLRTTVTNVLDLSKIEANRMPVSVRSFDLRGVVAEAAESARVLVREKPVAVDVAVPPLPVPVDSDPVKVRQILLNLASNAAKFTETGSIQLGIARAHHSVSVSVIDTGAGIREAHLDRLFTAFSQIEEASTKRHEGTGLGLVIARSMARLLGGDLSAASVFGKGSTFTLTLPATGPDEEDKDGAAKKEDHDH